MTEQVENGSRQKYFFLLNRSDRQARTQATRYLRELGVQILHLHGDIALVGIATPTTVEAASESGLFATVTSQTVQRSHLERVSPAQRAAIATWNAGLAPEYRRSSRAPAERDKSWASGDRQAPGPSTPYDPIQFRDLMIRRLGLDPSEMRERQQATRGRRLAGADFVAYERRLAERFGDPTIAYHLARIAARLGPAWGDIIADLDQEFVHDFFADEEVACWRMEDEIAVGVVFVESARPDGPTFSSSERSKLEGEIVDGLDWLAQQAPVAARLTWVTDWQYVAIDVANGDDESEEDYWRDPATGLVSFNGASYSADWTGVVAYREDLRQHFGSQHAIALFVTPFGNDWHAYASGGRITLANRDDWGGWGIGKVDEILAHEACHLFGAADEYVGDEEDAGTPCSSCDSTHGCFNIPNGNCGQCASPHQKCLMSRTSRRLCAYTQGQIGWADLFVEVTTADVEWAGTDDTVWIDLGNHVFNLDTPNHNDRERGNVEGYALNYTGVTRAHVKRVGIRKSKDGEDGGWMVERVRVWAGGGMFCDEYVNEWLEDNNRWWVTEHCGSGSDIVNRLRVEVTTGDVPNAGTDDDVTLTLGCRTWKLDDPDRNDFERGQTNRFDLDPGPCLYVSMLGQIRIHKSPDGSYGGWRLGGLRIEANGTTIYNNQQINQWLEDNDRDWFGTI